MALCGVDVDVLDGVSGNVSERFKEIFRTFREALSTSPFTINHKRLPTTASHSQPPPTTASHSQPPPTTASHSQPPPTTTAATADEGGDRGRVEELCGVPQQGTRGVQEREQAVASGKSL